MGIPSRLPFADSIPFHSADSSTLARFQGQDLKFSSPLSKKRSTIDHAPATESIVLLG